MERWLDLGQRKQLLPYGQQFGRWSDGAEMISLALCGGDGGEGVVELDAVLRRARMKQELPGTENGGDPQGCQLLREWLSAAYAEEEGCRTDPGQLLLAGGSAEAMDIILRWRLNIGGTVLLETPASPEMLEAIRQQGGQAILVPCDKEGMIIEALEREIGKERPSLIYAAPRYSNPSGRVWSVQRQRELLRLTARHSLLVVEDDCAGAIPFVSKAVTDGGRGKQAVCVAEPHTLYRLWQEESSLYSSAEVVGIGSFQATAFPSLPVAWIRGSERSTQALTHVRSAMRRGLKSPALEKAAYEQRLYALLSAPAFSWPEHAARLAAEYAARRAAMLEQLREQPAWHGASFEEPQGGLFLWLRLPPGLCSEALLRAALPKGAAFMPGARCYAAGAEAMPDGDAIRLTYAAHSAARLRRGMTRIAEAIAEFTARGLG
ncbi:PLP-dependent aminotransferase family protein [Paenibacillus sp. YSY-4.3]